MDSRTYIKILFLTILGYVFFIGFYFLNMDGIVGLTRKTGGDGCICHDPVPSSSVSVWIEGHDSVTVGTTKTYKIFVRGGPAKTGGFNVAAGRGQLSPFDNSTRLMFSEPDFELTHSSQKHFERDTVSWLFNYTAPSIVGIDTLYSVGNSTNNDGQPEPYLDLWNFGKDFVIKIIASNNDVNENFTHQTFYLEQNYPNPFNSITNIRYSLPIDCWVTIRIFNMLGQTLATVVDEKRIAGTHTAYFSSEGIPGGIYFYELRNEYYCDLKKMVILR